MVSVKPVKEKASVNYPVLIKGLKETIEGLNKDIDDRDHQIISLQGKIKELGDELDHAHKHEHKRMRTEIPIEVLAMMTHEDDHGEVSIPDHHIAHEVDEDETNREIKTALQKHSSMRGDAQVLGSLLGKDGNVLTQKSRRFAVDEIGGKATDAAMVDFIAESDSEDEDFNDADDIDLDRD